jgi:methylmalonyl-CoA mutase cobalamin-binding subunit
LARATALLDAGGFHAETVDADHATDAIERTKARVAMLCAGPSALDARGPALVRKLVRAGATHVVVAGPAGKKRDALGEAGVAAFVEPGMEIPAFVGRLQRAVGVEP